MKFTRDCLAFGKLLDNMKTLSSIVISIQNGNREYFLKEILKLIKDDCKNLSKMELFKKKIKYN